MKWSKGYGKKRVQKKGKVVLFSFLIFQLNGGDEQEEILSSGGKNIRKRLNIYMVLHKRDLSHIHTTLPGVGQLQCSGAIPNACLRIALVELWRAGDQTWVLACKAWAPGLWVISTLNQIWTSWYLGHTQQHLRLTSCSVLGRLWSTGFGIWTPACKTYAPAHWAISLALKQILKTTTDIVLCYMWLDLCFN